MSSRHRKFESGFEKHANIEEQVCFENQSVDDLDVNVEIGASNINANLSSPIISQKKDYEHFGDILDANMLDSNSGSIPYANDFENFGAIHDIFDPRMWDALDSKIVDFLAVKGPKRDLSIVKGPKDKFSKRFTSTCYTRILPNGEKCDRNWLVYSKELDKLFCFCCKLFTQKYLRGQLSNEGFGDWSHLSIRLREHETSLEHINNMSSWYERRLRLQKNQTIDQTTQKEFQKEKDHWKKVLVRIISIVKFLATHNLPFQGTNEKLYQNSNGNFLGLVEMLAEFDPIIQEHVQRVKNDEIHFHYLGHRIQNELILLLASRIKFEIVKKIKQAKYFSVILDCTPDISHQEQMSLIIRYVVLSSNSVSIEESFLGFLDVNDTTGQGLFNILQNELKSLDLDIDNVRGQSYDNGSNMKGKHQGVQKKMLDTNPRAFHTSCASHSLNLLLCDMANTCGKARDFFGIIQRIYTIFSNSTKRWHILKENVKGLTLKPLSSTRWESRVDSVKAIRSQMQEIREALLQVAESDNDSKIRSEAKSLAQNELGDFEFVVSIVLWFEMLCAVNLVSKYLQSKDMLVDVAIKEVKGLISFFEEYRKTGLSSALKEDEEIAMKMNIDPIFPQKREIRRKKQYDENNDEISLSREESFKINYFYYIVDQAIVSLKSRFEQYQEFENIFGFLCTSHRLLSLDDMSLKSSYSLIETALKKNEQSDIDGYELYVELKLLQNLLPRELMQPIDILNYIKRLDCFPNAFIIYRILFTIPVTVASAERSFSKLKLLKSYMRSTMTQERLNGLALLAIENNLLDEIDYGGLIEDFVSNNTRRMMLFK